MEVLVATYAHMAVFPNNDYSHYVVIDKKGACIKEGYLYPQIDNPPSSKHPKDDNYSPDSIFNYQIEKYRPQPNSLFGFSDFGSHIDTNILVPTVKDVDASAIAYFKLSKMDSFYDTIGILEDGKNAHAYLAYRNRDKEILSQMKAAKLSIVKLSCCYEGKQAFSSSGDVYVNVHAVTDVGYPHQNTLENPSLRKNVSELLTQRAAVYFGPDTIVGVYGSRCRIQNLIDNARRNNATQKAER